MNYRLTWLEYWSTQREADDPRVLIRYEKGPDDWWEHECHLYFNASNDNTARRYATDYIANTTSPVEVFSVYNRGNDKVIMTEET